MRLRNRSVNKCLRNVENEQNNLINCVGLKFNKKITRFRAKYEKKPTSETSEGRYNQPFIS